MRAEITVKIELDDDTVHEIMEDEGYDEYTDEDVHTILDGCNIGVLIDNCPKLVTKTISVEE